MIKIALVGMGGLGREIASYIEHFEPELTITGYYDDIEKDLKWPHLGAINMLSGVATDVSLILTIGDTQVKQNLMEKIAHRNFRSINYGKVFSDEVRIGRGSVICPGVVITVNVKIGAFCLVNLNCSIGHDVDVGDYCSIMPGCHISGNVILGKGVMVGTGSQILQGLKIGDGARIGAGAVVTKDVKAGVTVVGVPAREVGNGEE